MKHEVITSRDNSLLQRARAVREGKLDELIFVEGLRLCEEALGSGLAIEAVIYSNEIAEKARARDFLTAVATTAERLVSVSEKLLATISYTKTPQGIVLLALRPSSGQELLVRAEAAMLVVMHNINNPVNVGAILRTAEAAGATGAITTAQTCDPFSAKALRGAMGSAFRLPIWSGPTYYEVISWCEQRNIRTICADPGGETDYIKLDWTQPFALIFGSESKGFAAEELRAASQTVAIPMQGNVESLNVAVTAGVLLYEAKRRRER
ncbi:MAG TPA: RNA methyltransferase [Pyrinomonadaceae bacterium]|nr:RNA methyltransferase [Pyrinomonadaceae bacterium]